MVKRAYVSAARRAVHCGYDVVMVHAAHGYLISEFLSGALNKRTDNYGGSLENRERFLLEVLFVYLFCYKLFSSFHSIF